MRALTVGTAFFSAALLAPPTPAASPAPEASTVPSAANERVPGVPADAPAPSAPREVRGEYVHLFASTALGRGMRFNNPFRLETQLGDDAESLSLTASYADFGLGASLGDPHGLRHGMVVHLSVALEGVRQEVVSFSYIALHDLYRDFLGYARAGFPIVLEPDRGGGFELAAGGAYLVRSGLGLTAELVSSVFVGAATWETEQTLIPIVSLQAGLWIDYEVLP